MGTVHQQIFCFLLGICLGHCCGHAHLHEGQGAEFVERGGVEGAPLCQVQHLKPVAVLPQGQAHRPPPLSLRTVHVLICTDGRLGALQGDEICA